MIEYIWTLAETMEVISTNKEFNYNFPLGTTGLKLAVLDNSCTRDDAETTVTVTVTGNMQPGQYCYYYKGLDEIPGGGTLAGAIRPAFAEVSKSVNLGFPSFSFDSTMFSARCQFFLQNLVEGAISSISVDTAGSGEAVVYQGMNRIWDSSSPAAADNPLTVGLTAFEVISDRTATVPASLTFLVDGTAPANSRVTHDGNTILPILSNVNPPEEKRNGGNSVTVFGHGLCDPMTVNFGGKSVNILSTNRKDTQYFVNAPPFSTDEIVQIIATSGSGTESNYVNYGYGSTCDSVDFTTTSLTNQIEDIDNIGLFTCVALGHDGSCTLEHSVLWYKSWVIMLKIYGDIPVLLQATEESNFVKIGNAATRDIFGITFDPRDVVLRPYVSTATLYWQDKARLNNPVSETWRNKAVDRLKPGTDSNGPVVCLVFDDTIMSGLPISNQEHGMKRPNLY